MQNDPWAAKRFDASIPLFVSAQDSPLFIGMADNKAKPFIALALEKLARNQQPLDRFSAGTCAVVGNSSNLTGSAYGEFIDRHDVVIRMNNAPVEPYAYDVGRKTTFSINYADKEALLPYQAETVNILRGLHEVKDQHFFMDYDNYTQQIIAQMPSIYALASRYPQTVLWHPKFVNYVTAAWYEENAVTNGASSGFYATIFALHICDKVDLFGFGANRYGAWGHYFEQSENRTKPDQHKPDYQEKLLDRFADKKLIAIYRGIPK